MNYLWGNIKSQFPIFSNNPELIYLDNSSTTQKPQSVIDAMSEYQISSYANIHRGAYSLAEQSELLYIDSKKKIANFIWWDFREIIYTYNATYASNILAQSLVKTYNIWKWDTVLIGIRDHHATIVPWQLLSEQYDFDIKFITIDKETLDVDRDDYTNKLKNNNVKVVICSHVSNVTWLVYDVRRLSTLIKQQSENALFVIDGSQSIPHMKIDVNELWCDAYFFTAHKMMWPTGVGVLWISKEKARNLQTTFWGGGIIESVTTDGCSLMRTADKFEPGTPNLIWIIGLSAAIDFYKNHNIYTYIQQYENTLYDIAVEGLSNNSFLSILWSHSSLWHTGIISLVVDNPIECSEKLAQKNICVRAWWHCAHPLLHYLWYDRGVVRISPYIYTTNDDIYSMVDLINTMYK